MTNKTKHHFAGIYKKRAQNSGELSKYQLFVQRPNSKGFTGKLQNSSKSKRN